MNNEICVFCEEGEVVSCMQLTKSTYKRHTTDLPLYYNECKFCGSDYAGAAEMRKSRQALLDWRSTVDLTSIT